MTDLMKMSKWLLPVHFAKKIRGVCYPTCLLFPLILHVPFHMYRDSMGYLKDPRAAWTVISKYTELREEE